ncbi:hypothetical protein [Cardinium endosymbiont of Dermatophagoides farinae]|uniref:hypothetical protein n=1 Tax=Cardinium endosymbiont of Dermatophagoides farinae TaxID=2597823 RepID=UPI0011843D3A|nr:hypothetical protein [Cardinium endosymbiont of Dermatophagoides farinae]TSJ80798.1 hypothetical protein FPG78_01910 [Cardinium endosymbiont of Dermatophagoides farinae]
MNKNVIEAIKKKLEELKKSMSNHELRVYHCLEEESKFVKELYTSNFNQYFRLKLINWRNALPKFVKDSNEDCKHWDKYIYNNCSDSDKKILIKNINDIIDTIKNHDKRYELCYKGFRFFLMLDHSHHSGECGRRLLKHIGDWKQACDTCCLNRLQTKNRTAAQAVQGGSNNGSISTDVQTNKHLVSGSETNYTIRQVMSLVV